MFRFQLADGSYMDVAPEHFDIFKQQNPDAMQVGDTFTDKQKHAKAETAARGALQEVYGNISGVPKPLLPLLWKAQRFTGGSASILSGLIKSGEAAVENIQGMDAEEQRKDGLNPVSVWLDEYDEFTRAFSTKHYDEEGNAQQFDKLWAKGEYGKALDVASDDAMASAPSMVLAVKFGVLGAGLLGLSTAGTTYKEDLEYRPDQTLESIGKNAIWAGSMEWLWEWVGGKAFRYINQMDKAGTSQKAIKNFTQNYITRLLGRTLGSSVAEASTEVMTAWTQDLGREEAYGDEIAIKDKISHMINAAAPAILLGGFGGAMSSVTRGDRRNLYKFVAPQKWKMEQLNLGKQIYDVTEDLEQANDINRPIFEEKLKNLRKKQQEHEQALVSKFENMSNSELTTYAKNLDKINNNLSIIGNKNHTRAAQEEAQDINTKLTQDNFNIIGKEYTAKDINIEQSIGEALKASEIISERLKKVKGINRDDLNIKTLNTQEEVDKVIKESGEEGIKSSDGAFIAKDKDGKATIYINKMVASEAFATNVLGHELLHYMVSRKFKTDNKSMAPLIGELKTYLQKNHSDAYARVQERIDKFYTNKDGTIKDGALEEYMNVFLI